MCRNFEKKKKEKDAVTHCERVWWCSTPCPWVTCVQNNESKKYEQSHKRSGWRCTFSRMRVRLVNGAFKLRSDRHPSFRKGVLVRRSRSYVCRCEIDSPFPVFHRERERERGWMNKFIVKNMLDQHAYKKDIVISKISLNISRIIPRIISLRRKNQEKIRKIFLREFKIRINRTKEHFRFFEKKTACSVYRCVNKFIRKKRKKESSIFESGRKISIPDWTFHVTMLTMLLLRSTRFDVRDKSSAYNRAQW